MITSFFKTSKPIHYLIFLSVLICMFAYQRIIVVDFQGSLSNILTELGYLIILLMSFFTLIFVVTKNNLTHNNGYAALYFCLFIGLIPSSLETNSVLISNAFILLSLRRIMSFKTNLNIKKKVFDASMWICLAAFFEPWAILFFLTLFFGMGLYSVNQIKNFAIPFCGILAVGILLTLYRILTENALPSITEYLPTINFKNFSFNNAIMETESFLFLVIVLFGIVSFIVKVFLKNRIKTHYSLVLILSAIIGISIVFVSKNHDLGGYLFAFAPSSVLLANFSETTKYHLLSNLLIGMLLFAVLLQLSLNIHVLFN